MSDLVALRVRVDDREVAGRLYGDALGGASLDAAGGTARWWLPQGFVVEAAVAGDRPGPAALVLAVDDLVAAEASLATAGVDVRRAGDEVVVDDPAIGGGVLTLVERAHPLAGAAGRTLARATIAGVAGVEVVDHVCLAVPDLARAVEVLGDVLGGRPVLGGDSPWGARALQLRYATSKLELLAPLRADGPIGRYLERRGGRAGVHHVTLLVADVAVAARELDAAGLPTVDTDTSADSWRETFVRPRAAQGLLLQLATTDRAYHATLTPDQLAGVLAGRYVAADHVMRAKEEPPS